MKTQTMKRLIEKAKYARGPWMFDERGGCLGIRDSHDNQIEDAGLGPMGSDLPGNLIAYSSSGSEYDIQRRAWTMPEEVRANYKLMSRAPELLHMLVDMITLVENHLRPDDSEDLVRIANAKDLVKTAITLD